MADLMKRLSRRARDLMAARPWTHCGRDPGFLLTTASQAEPMLVRVTGNAGDRHGLLLSLEGDPFAYLETTESGERERGGGARGSSVGLFFEPESSELSGLRLPDSGAPAGAGRGLAPHVAIHLEGGEVRPCDREHALLMLAAIEAVLMLVDGNQLRACDLSGEHLVEVRLTGKIKDPRMETRLVRRTRRPRARPDSPPGSGADFEDGPGRRWVLACLEVPARGRGASGVWVAICLQEDAGMLLDATVVTDGPATAARDLYLRCVEGENHLGVSGHPAEVLTQDAAVIDALADVPEANARFGILADDVRAVVEDLAERCASVLANSSGSIEDLVEHDLDTYEGRKAFDMGLIHLFERLVEESERSLERAANRYFGSPADLPPEDTMAHPSFMEWAACAYRPTRRSKSLVEPVLEDDRWPPAHREALRHRAEATPAFYRVSALDPGLSLELENLGTGELTTVSDRQLSMSAEVGMILVLKVFRSGPDHFCSLAGPPLAPTAQLPAMLMMEEKQIDLTHPVPAHKALFFGRLWGQAAERTGVRPEVRTSDGEVLEPSEAHYRVDDPEALLAALRARDDFEEAEPGVHFVRNAPARPGWVGDEVVVAHLDLLADSLVAHTVSTPRFESLDEILTAIPGVSFLRRESRDPFDRPTDDRLPNLEPDADLFDDEEVVSQIQDFVLTTYLRTLDEPLELFGGMSPREAARDPAMRPRVERWVRSLPPVAGPGGRSLEPPRDRILQALGLA